MSQLLPEVKDLFESLNGEKRYFEKAGKSEEWKSFISFVEGVDERAKKLKRKLVEETPDYLKEPVEYAITSKKNEDRTLLFCTSILSCGENPWNFIDICFTADLIDYSIVIVDDMLDKTERRAERPSHYVKSGQSITISVSEYLKAKAFQIITSSSLPYDTKVTLLDALHRICLEVYKGQFLDAQFESENEISINDYIKMIELTTGSQVKLLFKMGTYMSKRDELEDVLGEIGLKLGTLGQIRDDIIDYIPDESLTWKQPFSDFLNNKKRLPLIIAWKNADDKERKRLEELHNKKILTPEEQMEINTIIFKPKNIDEIYRIIKGIEDEGLKLVNSAEITEEGRNILKTLFKLSADEVL